MKNQPFFRAYPLNKWNIVTIVGYTLFSVGLLFYYLFANQPKVGILPVYLIVTQLGLYFGQYRAIRNVYVHAFWFMVGIAHLVTAYYIAHNPALSGVCGLLTNTLATVILLQLLRFASLKLQGKELVAADKGSFDMFKERKITWTDRLLFFVYFVCGIFGFKFFSVYSEKYLLNPIWLH